LGGITTEYFSQEVFKVTKEVPLILSLLLCRLMGKKYKSIPFHLLVPLKGEIHPSIHGIIMRRLQWEYHSLKAHVKTNNFWSSASLYFLIIPVRKLIIVIVIVTIIVVLPVKAHQDGASPAKSGEWNKHQVKGRAMMWARKTPVINLPRFCSYGNLYFENKLWKAWGKCQDCDDSMNYL